MLILYLYLSAGFRFGGEILRNRVDFDGLATGRELPVAIGEFRKPRLGHCRC